MWATTLWKSNCEYIFSGISCNKPGILHANVYDVNENRTVPFFYTNANLIFSHVRIPLTSSSDELITVTKCIWTWIENSFIFFHRIPTCRTDWIYVINSGCYSNKRCPSTLLLYVFRVFPKHNPIGHVFSF